MVLAKNYEKSDDYSRPDVSGTLKSLIEVNVPVINECAWKNGYDSKMICAGTATKRTDHGDSGGPLLFNATTNNELYQIGVVHGGIYTNIYKRPYLCAMDASILNNAYVFGEEEKSESFFWYGVVLGLVVAAVIIIILQKFNINLYLLCSSLLKRFYILMQKFVADFLNAQPQQQQQQHRLTPTNSSYAFYPTAPAASSEYVHIGMPHNPASYRPPDYHFQPQRQGSNTNLRTSSSDEAETKMLLKQHGIAYKFSSYQGWDVTKANLNDIAIIEFPAGTNLNVTPMALAKNYVEGAADTALSFGYGDDDPRPDVSGTPTTLMEGILPVIKECAWKNINDKIICAGTKTTRTDHGDSGGPLVISPNNALYQIGVVHGGSYANGSTANQDSGVVKTLLTPSSPQEQQAAASSSDYHFDAYNGAVF